MNSRESLEAISTVSVPTSGGAQVPLGQLATIETVLGPQEIKGERGLLVGYVTMNTRDRDEVVSRRIERRTCTESGTL